jgi:hypothetical protein
MSMGLGGSYIQSYEPPDLQGQTAYQSPAVKHDRSWVPTRPLNELAPAAANGVAVLQIHGARRHERIFASSPRLGGLPFLEISPTHPGFCARSAASGGRIVQTAAFRGVMTLAVMLPLAHTGPAELGIDGGDLMHTMTVNQSRPINVDVAASFERTVNTIRSEFTETPGMQPTRWQCRRLWNLTCLSATTSCTS